jgi:hypothetical protein
MIALIVATTTMQLVLARAADSQDTPASRVNGTPSRCSRSSKR